MLPFFDTGVQITMAMLALYGLLAATSLSVRLAAQGSAPGMLSHQVNAWWRIFPFVTLAFLTYPLGLAALCYLIWLLACRELRSHDDGPSLHYWLVVAAIMVTATLLGWKRPLLAWALIPAAILLQVLRCWIRPHRRNMVWLLILVTAGAMYVLAAYIRLPFGSETNMAWLFYLFILTALNDIAQFVSGTLFGRHKIAPSISPNKTWQGLAGGIAVSLAVSLILGTWLSLAAPATLAMYGLLLSIAGFIGDLMFSAAKRYLAIKDFSALIPGHGGILDRIDSLVLTAPLLYCLLHRVE